jgi:hypothetical protein
MGIDKQLDKVHSLQFWDARSLQTDLRNHENMGIATHRKEVRLLG